MDIKQFFIDSFLPKNLYKFLLGFYAGWHGNYLNFKSARKHSHSYSDRSIFDASLRKTIEAMKQNSKLYERDGALITEVELQSPILLAFIKVLSKKNRELRVLDFGGGLGSLYRQLRYYLPRLKWVVVEQSGLVNLTKDTISDESLKFYDSLADAYRFAPRYDLVIFSSVLQYLENPYIQLQSILDKKPNVVVVDRTLFSKRNVSYVAVQKVPRHIYGFSTSYPCWVLNKLELISFFVKNGYKLISETRSKIDESNRFDDEFLGLVFSNHD